SSEQSLSEGARRDYSSNRSPPTRLTTAHCSLLTAHMLDFAIQTAREAGRVLAEKFGRALQVSNKGDIDLVTDADIAAERLIVERIRSYHPRHAILTEESGDVVSLGDAGSEYK